MESDKSSECFSIGQSAQEMGFTHVPQRYQVPQSQRPSLDSPQAEVPVIDLAGLREGPTQRAAVIDKIREACSSFGFFQVNLTFLR